jgi:ubiquinone/menaquinone biosynthesis C-methylase UbiE
MHPIVHRIAGLTGMASRTPTQERWLRFYNRTVYEAFPAAYNALDRLTLGVWWSLVRRALDDIPPGGRVLEIGFGPGRLHVELARRSSLCVGLDLAYGMCRFTQQRMARAGLRSHLTRANAARLPFPDQVFDSVASTFALSAFPDGSQAVGEMARVTRPGGRIVLVDIGLPAGGNRLGVALARLWERMGDYLYDQGRLMQAAGLQVVEFKEFGPGEHIRLVVGLKVGQEQGM